MPDALSGQERRRRLFARIVKVDGCWLWRGPKTQRGYGLAYSPRHRGSRPAHRVFYEMLVGTIPAGHDLDHLCRIRECVNPEHLEPVTRSENIRRAKSGTLTREAA